MKTPLLIFDCDGVLVDSEHIASTVFAEHLRQLGLDYNARRCRQLFTGLSLHSCQLQIEQTHRLTLPPHFFDNMQEDTLARFASELRPIDGIIAALDALDSRQLPYCVASSGDHRKIRYTLGHTGLLPRFEGRIFSAADVRRGKPAPDLFLHAAQQLGHFPAGSIVIEDAVPGIAAARAAGMTALLYQPRSNPSQDNPLQGNAPTAAPDATFRDMAELPDMIDRHRRSLTP